jgi:enoyl-CoA hydratase/carnithine racemase
MIGDVINSRRLDALIKAKFSDVEKRLLIERLHTERYSDEVIDHALRTLKDADVEINGEFATMSSQGVFDWLGWPFVKFRRVEGSWKLDAQRLWCFQRPADCLAPEAWGFYFLGGSDVLDQLIGDIQAGKLKTADEVLKAYEALDSGSRERVAEEAKRRKLGPVDAAYFAAWKICLRFRAEYSAGRAGILGINKWSLRLMEAEQRRSRDQAERVEAAAAHLDRTKDVSVLTMLRAAARRYPSSSYLLCDYFLSEAEILLERDHTPPQRAAVRRAAAAELLYSEESELLTRNARWGWLDSALNYAVWSRDATWAMSRNPEDQRSVLNEYLERTQELEKIAQASFKAQRVPMQHLREVVFFRSDAELGVALTEPKANKDTSKLLKTRLEAAKGEYDGRWKEFQEGRDQLQVIYECSLRLRKAELGIKPTKEETDRATAAHLERMKRIHEQVKSWHDAGRVATYDLWSTEFYIAEAEIWLAEAKVRGPQRP